MFLRNVLHPSSDWLYLVQVETELNGRRKWVNHTGTLQGFLWIWVTQREEERDLVPFQLSKTSVLSVLYNQPISLHLLPSLPETNSVTLTMSVACSSETLNQPYNLQSMITNKTINCATTALEAWTISQTFIYSVFLMAKPNVDVFREDKTYMVNGMLTEWSWGNIWLGHAAFSVPVTDFCK